MEEKLIETKEEQPAEEKKAYTPPALIVYGKLTELTAGGSANAHEAGNPHEPKLRP
jgi:hypothetical protein